jgi:hypothetical protein
MPFALKEAAIPEAAELIILEPEIGAAGFEQSTFFFLFKKANKSVADFNYRLCFNPGEHVGGCPRE